MEIVDRVNFSKCFVSLFLLLFLVRVQKADAQTAKIDTLQKQTIGLVLSGGGAKGLAHLGVIKFLKEKQVPIDYIVGTSMGSVVGGMFAAGYKPSEMEQVVLSEEFQDWAAGRISQSEGFLHPADKTDGSFLSFSLRLDTLWNPSFQNTLISNDAPLNFALMQFLFRASHKANYNFDKLPIPFRCMGADIFTQKAIALDSGNLNEAVRASMAVPLVFRPIKVNGRYLFDGGIYDNFPLDVMLEEFKPDIMIGVNVSTSAFEEYPYNKDEELIKDAAIYLFDNADLSYFRKGDVYIKPEMGSIGSSDFDRVEEAIQIGYDATQVAWDSLKKVLPQRKQPLQQSRWGELTAMQRKDIVDIEAKGIGRRGKHYIERALASRKDIKAKAMTLEELRTGYYRLITEPYFQQASPSMNYDSAKSGYIFELAIEPQQQIKAYLGGNLSNQSNAGFTGLSYSWLNRAFYQFHASAFIGDFYNSVKANARIYPPSYLPFFLELEGSYNSWAFANTKDLLIKKTSGVALDRFDRTLSVSLGVYNNRRSLWRFMVKRFTQEDEYFSTEAFNILDELDATRFSGWLGSISYYQNSLDHKLWPSSGKMTQAFLRFATVEENYQPGTTSMIEVEQFHRRRWPSIEYHHERYWGEKVRGGWEVQAGLSSIPRMSNYWGTLLTTPAYYPLIDSKTLFLQDFRSPAYLATGMKLIVPLWKSDNLSFQTSGHLFKPFTVLEEGERQEAIWRNTWKEWEYAASASLVYQTPFGPVSASVNHYSDKVYQWRFLINVGFMLFNQRPMED